MWASLHQNYPISCLVWNVEGYLPRFMVEYTLGGNTVCSELVINDFVCEVYHLRYYEILLSAEKLTLEDIVKDSSEPIIGAIMLPLSDELLFTKRKKESVCNAYTVADMYWNYFRF